MEGLLALHLRLEDDPRVAGIQSLASLVPNPDASWIRSLSPATLTANPDRLRLAERLANIEGDNSTTVLIVYPSNSETDKDTVDLMLDLRANAQEWAPQLTAVNVLVGGSPAQHYDFDRVVYDQFPLLLGLSLLVTFVILMLFFHSIVLPIKAIILNLTGLAASYGLLVLVFQYGVGDSLLGFESLGAVLSYTPVLLFSILFGLSTDYEVFMLSRVREYVREGYSNEDSVAHGLDRTAGVITAAGLIMIVVFGSFAFTGVLVIKEIGFALAVAVLLDMTLVRMVLVPASMKLMERANWWMPKALDRILPEIDEGGPATPHPPPPAPAPVTGGE
jgi:RND superfamily putative drug exporter